jgi:hypothetical protein
MFQTKFVEKIKTHILWSITFSFQKSCRLWNNVDKYGTAEEANDDNMIGRMRFAWWITKVTDTLRICNCFFTATVVTRTPLSITVYVCCLSCLVPGWFMSQVASGSYLNPTLLPWRWRQHFFETSEQANPIPGMHKSPDLGRRATKVCTVARNTVETSYSTNFMCV